MMWGLSWQAPWRLSHQAHHTCVVSDVTGSSCFSSEATVDEKHGLTTITRRSLEPWAHFSVSFPQNAGLERFPLAATILPQAAACQMEDKPSEKFTKHYSLVNWTMLTPDSCSWNLFSKKQKLWSFKRCSVYAALCAKIPPELNKTHSSFLIKPETVPHLDDSFQGFTSLALLSFLKHVIVQCTEAWWPLCTQAGSIQAVC